jgi:methionine-rich copper-binding protein CopC
VVRGVAQRFDGTVIPPAELDSGEFRDDTGKFRATPDVVEATPDVEGGFTVRYRAPYTGFRNSNGLTEEQRKQALLTQDGHAIGFGHVEPLPRESMLVEGIADVTGPAPGCENFSQDLMPPKPVGQSPAPDARDVGRLTNVTVGFDEPVTGLTDQTFTLTGSDGARVPAKLSYNGATRVATLNPFPDSATAALAPGTRYTAAVSDTVTDAAGNALPKTTWSFVTSGEGPDNDRTAPTVVSRAPAGEATGAALGANVLIGFSEAMAKPTAEQVYVRPSGSTQALSSAVNYNATTKSVIVNPDDNLAPGTWYDVVLTDGVADLAGNKVAPETWRFQTSGTASGDTAAPTVASQSPAPGASGVAKGANVLVGMSEPIAKPDSSSVWLETANGTKVPAAVNYNATSNTVIVNPDGDLVAGTYQVVLTDGVRDVAGNSLAPTDWTFTVGAASSDTVAPTVTGRTPDLDATGVGLGSNVFIAFSEPITKPAASSVWLRAPDGSTVAAAVNYYASSNTVILNPTADLAGGTTYTVVLTAGVTDLAANPVAAEEWAFTTR